MHLIRLDVQQGVNIVQEIDQKIYKDLGVLHQSKILKVRVEGEEKFCGTTPDINFSQIRTPISVAGIRHD